MLELSHVITLMLFIVIGGIGMASMQDGLGIIGQRLLMFFRRHTHAKRSAVVRAHRFMTTE